MLSIFVRKWKAVSVQPLQADEMFQLLRCATWGNDANADVQQRPLGFAVVIWQCCDFLPGV